MLDAVLRYSQFNYFLTISFTQLQAEIVRIASIIIFASLKTDLILRDSQYRHLLSCT